MEFPKPNENHAWLKKFVGKWKFEHPGPDGTSHPADETIESMGDYWVRITQTGSAPEVGTVENLILLSYDVAKEKFVGTFVSSMMSGLWIYEGDLNEDRKKLTLASNGPSMGDPNKIVTYHDIVEWISDEEYVFRSEVQGDDGNFVEIMKMPHKRV